MDFKNLNIMVGIAALFSTVSLTPYASQIEEQKQHNESISHEKQINKTTYTILTSVNDIISKKYEFFKEYESYAHMIMMNSNSDKFLTNDIANNFVIFMIPHHEAAIISSLGVIEYTKDSKVKSLAEEIVKSQKKEVIQMQNLLKSGDLRGNNNPEFKITLEKIMSEMMKDMSIYKSNSNTSKDITTSYLKNMIIHHNGAIKMAQAYLEQGKNQILLNMCENIISSQENEIKKMNELLKNINKN